MALTRTRTAALLAALMLLPAALIGQEENRPPNIGLGPLVSGYTAADPVFKLVYGTGGTMAGAHFGVDLFRTAGFSLALALEARTFSRTGTSTFSGTATTLSFTPLSAGAEAHWSGSVVGIWVGAGIDSITYSEESALKNSSGSTLGTHLDGGLLFQVPSFPLLALRLFARWTRAVVTLTDFTVDLGGTELGLTLLFRFRI